MANVKISQLPIASAVTGDDFVAMVDSGSLATQQASFEKVLNYVTSSTFNTLTVTDLQGTSADFTSLTGTLQGNASSATNATAVNTVFNNDNAVKYIPFVDTNGNQELKIDSGITYVPFSDSLSVNGTVKGLKFESINDSNYFVRPDSNSYLKTTFFTTSATVNGYTEISETYIYGQGPADSFNISSTGNSWFRSNVGIGTTSPSEMLDVRTSTVTAGQGARLGEAKVGTWYGTDYAEFSHYINSNSPTDYALIQRSSGTTVLNAKSGQSVAFSISNATKMIVNSVGNVGIGTTSPSEKLEVVGNSIFSGSVEVSGTLRADVEVSGNITAASYTLSAADYGKTLLFSSSATQDITCSSGLDVGFNVTAIQAGTGQLNFSGSGVTLVNRFAHTSSAGQYSAVSVIVLNGTQYLIVGDTA